MHGKRAGGFHELDLTREQRQQIGRIMREQHKAHREIHQRYLDKLPQKEREAMQKEFRDNREKRQQEIRGVLTPEQQKRFDERRKQMEERRAEWKEFQQWKAEKQKARYYSPASPRRSGPMPDRLFSIGGETLCARSSGESWRVSGWLWPWWPVSPFCWAVPSTRIPGSLPAIRW